jgi:hypothetical protein
MTDTRTDATALEALAARVEGGEAGREIDALVYVRLIPSSPSDRFYGKGPNTYRHSIPTRDDQCAKGTYWIDDGFGKSLHTAPELSTSLDAVAALAERVLPGWYANVFRHTGSDKYTSEFYIPSLASPFPNVFARGQAPTECAARLAAILRAKAKGGE